MTKILIIISIILAIILIATNTSGKEQNRIECAVNGKQEDCKTPRTTEQALCDQFYGYGMCDTNGEVYPEYTKEAIEIQKNK